MSSRRNAAAFTNQSLAPDSGISDGALHHTPPYAIAWNIHAHMLSGALAYQILRHKSPSTIAAVKTALESHPWYESHWRAQKVSATDPDEMLFMLAARWADDIRMQDRSQNRGPWHYINLPFKPEGQPDIVRTKPPAKVPFDPPTGEQLAAPTVEEARRAVELTLGNIRGGAGARKASGFFFLVGIARGLQFRFLFATMEQEFGDSSSS